MKKKLIILTTILALVLTGCSMPNIPFLKKEPVLDPNVQYLYDSEGKVMIDEQGNPMVAPTPEPTPPPTQEELIGVTYKELLEDTREYQSVLLTTYVSPADDIDILEDVPAIAIYYKVDAESKTACKYIYDSTSEDKMSYAYYDNRNSKGYVNDGLKGWIANDNNRLTKLAVCLSSKAFEPENIEADDTIVRITGKLKQTTDKELIQSFLTAHYAGVEDINLQGDYKRDSHALYQLLLSFNDANNNFVKIVITPFETEDAVVIPECAKNLEVPQQQIAALEQNVSNIPDEVLLNCAIIKIDGSVVDNEELASILAIDNEALVNSMGANDVELVISTIADLIYNNTVGSFKELYTNKEDVFADSDYIIAANIIFDRLAEIDSKATPTDIEKMLQSSLESAEVEEEEEEPVIGKVTTKVNVRAGAGTDYDKIGSCAANDEVQVAGEEDGWYSVTLSDGTEGYIKSDYVEVIE